MPDFKHILVYVVIAGVVVWASNHFAPVKNVIG